MVHPLVHLRYFAALIAIAFLFMISVGGSMAQIAEEAKPTVSGLLEQLERAVHSQSIEEVGMLAQEIGRRGDPSAIPHLIGIIDCDNSHDVIYLIGWCALTPLTGERYDYTHHGSWWRKWWEVNRDQLPETVRQIQIPELPKTQTGEGFAADPPDPESIILEPTLDQLLERLKHNLHEGDTAKIMDTAQWIAEFENPRAIPILIDLIELDVSPLAGYWVGWYGLAPLTGVDYDESHDAAWWAQWWEGNRKEYEDRIAEARAKEPPSGDLHVPSHQRPLIDAPDVAGIPATDCLVDECPFKRYVLIGDAEGAAPPGGYRMLIVLPGGSGSPDFHPFIKRIHKNVLSPSWLLVQIVAPEWDRRQSKRLVWPTEATLSGNIRFSTEELVLEVVRDVRRRVPVSDQFIFTLSWSSSGPAAYALSLHPKSPVTGSLVAMSVFKPETLPSLQNAEDHAYYILHSPQDFIPIKHAELARDELAAHGASTVLKPYEGGHGWRGDVWQNLRDGISWLEWAVSIDDSREGSHSAPRTQ